MNNPNEFSRANQQKNQTLSQSVFVTSDQLERRKTIDKSSMYQSKEDGSQAQDSAMIVKDKIFIKGVTFITEKDYKKQDICFVCKQGFTAFNRQHHCRLCSNSVCDFCSLQRVNDNRVCDICFFKVKNLQGEKRKQNLLETLNTVYNQLTNYCLTEQKNLEILDQMIIDEQKKLEYSKEQIQNDTEMQDKMTKKLETERNSKKDDIDQLDQDYRKKKQHILQLERDPEGIDDLNDRLKIQDHEIQFRIQTLEGQQNLFKLLQQQIQDKEQTDDFQKLPNYQNAKNLDESNIAALLVQLDQESPPELYFKQQEEKIKLQIRETYKKIQATQKQFASPQKPPEKNQSEISNNSIIVTHNLKQDPSK